MAIHVEMRYFHSLTYEKVENGVLWLTRGSEQQV